ncbi:uncharacterized protein LOC113305814 [Papaver somniferum]|uniref:uncharacterized protein LOC113305814 n=1 Tax=Papaver somniferum TaxID=3469 RepID=UPI000E6F93D0|nr:uncharacterized protein LOC113305814 [Papaver somniferum]
MTSSSPADSSSFLQYIPQCITAEDNQQLEAIPTEKEIHSALMTMEPWTSPGPDGFPPGFYQTQWKTVKDNVCKLVKSFFHSGKIDFVKHMFSTGNCTSNEEKRRQLISQCISTKQIEVMLNGSPTSAFKPSRGIRQGDPLSPYLFILAVESFSRYLAHCENSGQLTGIKNSRSAPKINHLLFAYDCLLFCKDNDTQVNKLLQVIDQFYKCSGQLINFNKSAIYFSSNMDPESCQPISGALQVRYLNISK